MDYTIELKEEKSYAYIVDEEKVKKEYNLTPDKYVAFVVDTTGKCYWSHDKLKRLRKLGRIK